MKKIHPFIFLSLCTVISVFAQVPEGFNYQAVVRNSSGEIITNTNVAFRISILQGSETGPSVYVETHSAKTNNFGLVNLIIGMGNVKEGVFMPGGWGVATNYIKVEFDPNGGTAFTHLGTSLLLSVPYAFHAQTVAEDAVNDADADPNNEIQELQLSGTQLSLSKGGGKVAIPSSADNWGTQTVTSDATLSGEGTTANPLKVANNTIEPTWANIKDKPGGFADNSDDVEDGDANPNNEIQTLSISGNDLSISDGNTVSLPAGVSSPWESSDNNIYYNSGNVGIGMNDPVSKLHVFGSARFRKDGGGLIIGPNTDHVTVSFEDNSGSFINTRFYWGKTEFQGNLIVREGNVGIGTTIPTASLHVTGDNGVLFEENSGKGTIPAEGRGTRMMWYPTKAAFRCGFAESAEWDDFLVGLYSSAMGLSTIASGSGATAMGQRTEASGVSSTAMGYDTKATNESSTAMGAFNEATGKFSTVMGAYNKATGENSTAIGYLTKASGKNSTAMGINTEASSYGSSAFGFSNIGGGSPTSWIDTDPLFEIGNGADFNNKSNAFTVLKNGNVGIGANAPERLLHIKGGNPRILIEASSSNPEINFKNTEDVSTSIWSIYKNGSTDDLHFYQNGNKLTVQKNTGNVGIGTTTPQGKLDVNGTIYQRGGVLHADYVFEDSYKLESIEEHTGFMWKNKHLPAIQKATVDENGVEIVEIGSHQKGIVEELEKAHIYISQLEKAINQQNLIIGELKKKTDNSDLTKRIEKLEKIIGDLETLNK